MDVVVAWQIKKTKQNKKTHTKGQQKKFTECVLHEEKKKNPVFRPRLSFSQTSSQSHHKSVLSEGDVQLHFLVLEHLQEERGKQFIGTLDLHVKETAGVASPDHAQVCHLHQQLGPKMGNVVLAVVYIVLERQKESLLALLNLLHAGQPWTVCRQ